MTTKTQTMTRMTDPVTMTAMSHGLTWMPEDPDVLGAGADSVLLTTLCCRARMLAMLKG